MNLSKIVFNPQVVTPWQAVDIGICLAKRWWLPMFLCWIIAPFSLMLLANIFLQSYPIASALVIWWFKPLWERLPLQYASQALFGEAPKPKTLQAALKSSLKIDMLAPLTWRRFSPARSYLSPVSVLEGLRGSARRKRIGLLTGNFSFAPAAVTLVFLGFEVLFPLSVATALNLFFPDWQALNYFGFWDWLPVHGWALWLLSWLAVCAMAVTAPFYICCGFSLYIHRRVELEGWDIEIKFRHLLNSARPLAVTLLLVGVGMLAALPGKQIHAQAQVPKPAEVIDTSSQRALSRSQIAEIMNHENFNQTKISYEWQKKDRTQVQDSWLQKLLELLTANENSDLPPDFIELLARVFELLLWFTLALAVCLLLYRYRQAFKLYKNHDQSIQPPEVNQPVVFGLNVRPDSLPRNICATALAMLNDGQVDKALKLLYRGALARYAGERIQFDRELTELECARRVTQLYPEQSHSQYFHMLTQQWLRMKYAHQPPEASEIMLLCKQWPLQFQAGEFRA